METHTDPDDDTLPNMTTMREQILVRVPPTTKARLDAYAKRLRRETGLRVPMTEIIRKLVDDGLTAAGEPAIEDEGEPATRLASAGYRGVIIGYARARELVDVDAHKARAAGDTARVAVLEEISARLRAEILAMGERAPVEAWGDG